MNYDKMASIINAVWPKISDPEAKNAFMAAILNDKADSTPTTNSKKYPKIDPSYVVRKNAASTNAGKRAENLSLSERFAARSKFIGRCVGFEKNGHTYWFKITNADSHRFFLAYDSGAEGTPEFKALSSCTSMLECERILGSKSKSTKPYAWKFRDTGMKYAHELMAVKLFNPYVCKSASK